MFPLPAGILLFSSSILVSQAHTMSYTIVHDNGLWGWPNSKNVSSLYCDIDVTKRRNAAWLWVSRSLPIHSIHTGGSWDYSWSTAITWYRVVVDQSECMRVRNHQFHQGGKMKPENGLIISTDISLDQHDQLCIYQISKFTRKPMASPVKCV